MKKKTLWPIFDKFVMIAGPCAVESSEQLLDIAGKLDLIAGELDIRLVFKASYDKANRTNIKSFRSIGMENAIDALRSVKDKYGLLIDTDVHETKQVKKVAEIADIIQIPAFLCRQTDLLTAAAETGRIVNIKKGQFMAPEDMEYAVEKVRKTGNEKVFVTERGSSFGYHNLVVDMRSLVILKRFAPVVFDATHSVQLPGGRGDSSGGRREFVPALSRAAAAVGIDGLFLETHHAPDSALSDGPNMVPPEQVKQILATVKTIHELVNNTN